MADSKFIRVALASEVPENSMKTFDVGGTKILVANVKGRYYGIGAICQHEEWDLSEGQLEGGRIVCAGHGAVWSLNDGSAEFEEPLPKEPLYEVKVEKDQILVNPSPNAIP